MRRVIRSIFVSAVAAALVGSASGRVVNAQNYTGIVPGRNEANAKTGMSAQEGYSEVELTYVDPNGDPIQMNIAGAVRYSEESSNYTLGKEDVIEIIVLRHPEVSGQFLINSEGKIQYEFIGDITVEGLKKDEVRDHLVEVLSEYIISPDVTVKIIGYNSKIVYVVGEVGAPGKIYMRGDTITVREALVQARLPLLTAKMTKSKVVTPSETGAGERKMVNVYKLLYEGDLRENLVMKPGDVLYVPPTLMTKAMRAIQPVSQPIDTAGTTGRRVYTGGF